VLNAKRSLLEVKLADTLEDFRRIVEQVSKDERGSKLTDRQKDL
jgi:hypothetical protein